MYSDEESDLSECEERCDEKLLNSLQSGYKLSVEEIKLKNTYSYDGEPVKAWRQYSDFTVLKECNEYIWYQISKFLGKFSGFSSSLNLYESRSKLVNLIEMIICKDKCYFLPGKCFLKHGYDLRYLMKQSLHDEYSQSFMDLFNNKKDDIKIEVEENGRPKLWELAEKLNFNTPLQYDEEGYLQVDFSVFQEKFWRNSRPCFIKEENKVLNAIHALLLSSSKKREEEIEEANNIYSQNLPGINDPVLKTMCFGPDIEFEPVGQVGGNCDLKGDEDRMRFFDFNVKHDVCSELMRDKHWKHHHGDGESNTSQCNHKEDLILEGPICEKNSQAICYPCNLKHCWICCDCKFCKLARLIHCKDHKDHIRYNIKECIIQENAQCQEHWVNHVENFDETEDIKVVVKLFFHKDQVMINGRNYSCKTVKYSGLKLACKKCKRNTQEHLNKHLTPHLQCKHCIYEMKTMVDKDFWGKVCNICGKVFESRSAMRLHANRYNVSEQVCEVCSMRFSSKFNLSRHISEQHGSMLEDRQFNDDENLDNSHKCNDCNKTFKFQRNLKLHVLNVHDKKKSYTCKLCEEEFSSKGNMNRHLEEQHSIFDLENPIQSKDPSEFLCNLCDKNFKRKEQLASHMNTHQSTENKYTCCDCGKQFASKSNFNCHRMIHTDNRETFMCNLCQKSFQGKVT